MKSKYIIFLLLFWHYNSSAQLAITSGGQFSVFSDTKLTLKNTDLINNGDFFLATTAPVSFTGDASSFIAGDQVVRFFKLEINKTNSQSVVLHKTISVGSTVFFTSGFFDLNGFNVDLETSGSVNGENNNSRFIGTNGGQVFITTTLNAPANINPGNLGMLISSSQNLGQVTVKRGHQSQSGSGLSSSLLRYFEILPANNTVATATLRFTYFDGELNGFDESSLSFFKSNNNVNWTSIGSSSSDAIANFVEVAVDDPFSRFTLSAGSNPLPVRFISFNINCDESGTIVHWKTAQEQNSAYYDVERSIDGINWTEIGKVAAAGVSAAENSYQFTDHSPSNDRYYRIAEYDVDGKVEYTNVLRSSCNAVDLLNIWPNPVHEKLFINLVAANQSQAQVNIFDSKGGLIRREQRTILAGSNQLSFEMSLLPNGFYYLSVVSNDGKIDKTIRVLKQ